MPRPGPIARLAGAAALMLALAVGAAPARDLTPDQMRRAGYDAQAAGQAELAVQIAQALIARDPADAVAHVILSRALRDLGRFDPAATAARRAWALATDDAQRYGAALAAAQALSSAGQRTAAQLWLRRAAQVAPTPLARTIAERDHAYVRSRNPWSLRLDLSVAPSSNVNNGSSQDSFDFLGLPFVLSGDARALSGVETRLGLSARYRLPPSGRGQTALRLSLQQTVVDLSEAARTQAPGARGSDYDFAAVEAGLSWQRPGRVGWGVEATLGHNLYGGAPLSDYLRLDLTADRRLGRGRAFAGLGLERQIRRDLAMRSASILTLRGGWTQPLARGDRLQLAAGARRSLSDAVEIDHTALTLSADWQRAAPLPMDLRLGLSLGVEARDYAISPYTADGRQDLRLTGAVSLGLERLDYLGFHPVLRIEAGQVRSNVALYDSQTLGLSLGLRSSF
ncbi:MAG: hypothetical protein IE927_04450 [Rhodobacterales bacterium]|nr:hypothetical protein [Rhodobacterales bacterium]